MVATNSLNIDEAGIVTYDTATGNFTCSATTQYNSLVGDTNNKLTNISPSATSGVPLISSGAAANPAFGTAVVAGGGTGNTTFTAYSVICAGTTSTGAFQNVSGVGTSGQGLQSNGASALPTWGTFAKGFALQISTTAANPADGTTYFIRDCSTITTSTTAGGNMQKMYIPRAGLLTACYGGFIVSGTLGSNENCSIILRINNTTDVTVSSAIQLTANPTNFGTGSLSQAVNAGDYIEVKFVCPTWATNPTTVSLSLSVGII